MTILSISNFLLMLGLTACTWKSVASLESYGPAIAEEEFDTILDDEAASKSPASIDYSKTKIKKSPEGCKKCREIEKEIVEFIREGRKIDALIAALCVGDMICVAAVEVFLSLVKKLVTEKEMQDLFDALVCKPLFC